VDLFDTTPDLCGQDLDVSRYIRDGEDSDVQFYWRDVDGENDKLPAGCGSQLLEDFTMIRLSNGMVLSWSMAKQMGYLPPDAKPNDLP
jgi:hypothetical protein